MPQEKPAPKRYFPRGGKRAAKTISRWRNQLSFKRWISSPARENFKERERRVWYALCACVQEFGLSPPAPSSVSQHVCSQLTFLEGYCAKHCSRHYSRDYFKPLIFMNQSHEFSEVWSMIYNYPHIEEEMRTSSGKFAYANLESSQIPRLGWEPGQLAPEPTLLTTTLRCPLKLENVLTKPCKLGI